MQCSHDLGEDIRFHFFQSISLLLHLTALKSFPAGFCPADEEHYVMRMDVSEVSNEANLHCTTFLKTDCDFSL